MFLSVKRGFDPDIMICVVSYILIFLLTSAPVFCGYVMEGGDAILWLERIREVRQNLAEGRFSMFPSPELITAHASGAVAFDNGIWLLPVVGMQLLGMGEQISYCFFMGLVGLGTMVSARWMMRAFSEKTAVVLFGTLFYMSCPYHIYICYDKADIGQAIVWALVPVFAGGMAHLHRSRGRSAAVWCMTALAYAGIWYADARWGVVAGVCMALYLLLWKRWIWGLLPLAAGGGLAMPSVIYLVRYLVKGGMQVWNLPMGSIMGGGYSVGLFMTTWTYRPDLPGMGMGLLGGIFLLAWLCFRGYQGKMDNSIKGLLVLAGVLAILSLKIFPWDYVQKLGIPFLRFVGLLETAGFFGGCADMLLVVPAAWAVGEVRKKQGELWQWVIPILLMSAALATALYMCNSLTYVRPPLGQEPVSTVAY